MILKCAKIEDMQKVKQLYLSAFPKEERPPFFLLRRGLKRQCGQLLIAEQDGSFVGFAYLVGTKDLGYVFFFAIHEQYRGCGYGSEVLRLLKEEYAHGRLFLAREALDACADNYDQRLRRHRFYLRNGFRDLPCKIREGAVTFDVMGVGGQIDPKEYTNLMDDWGGKWLRKLIPMTMTIE